MHNTVYHNLIKINYVEKPIPKPSDENLKFHRRGGILEKEILYCKSNLTKDINWCNLKEKMRKLYT